MRKKHSITVAENVAPATSPLDIEIAAPVEPTRAEIAALAYSYWEARGFQGGSPEEDWARAEAELRGAVTA